MEAELRDPLVGRLMKARIADDGAFFEDMRDDTLAWLLECNCVWEQQVMASMGVESQWWWDWVV